MSEIVEVFTKNVYGSDLVYPHNRRARQFAALIGKKTFSRVDLSRIEAIGFAVINLSFVDSQF